jgi:hypothetical protein
MKRSTNRYTPRKSQSSSLTRTLLRCAASQIEEIHSDDVVARSRSGLRFKALTSEIWALRIKRWQPSRVRTSSANFDVSQNVSLSGRLPRTLPPGIRRGRRLWPLRIEPPISRLERRCVPFVSLSLLGFPRSDDQRMTRFIHAHLHCIFSLLSPAKLFATLLFVSCPGSPCFLPSAVMPFSCR